MKYTVKQLSKIAGISVRTLHYYDEIGLLKPSIVEKNGYRYYEKKELLKLQQILFFKELEFPLNDIRNIINSPAFRTKEALQDQKTLLTLKKKRITNLIQTIERTLESLKGGEIKMNTDDLFGSFSEEQMNEYKEEAKRRWGHTDAYKQSMKRTKNWTKEDYKKVSREWEEFNRKLAATMDQGYDSPEFQLLIAQQHEKVNAFYDCSLEMFRGLGDMYTQDPRFRKTYDSFKPGLADAMQKAINFYCDQKETR